MKARRIFLFFAFLGGLASAQSDEALRFRYWKLRQKLLVTYVVVGDCHGCSIPASKRDVKASIMASIFSPQFIV
jgi:hypothetical protein